MEKMKEGKNKKSKRDEETKRKQKNGEGTKWDKQGTKQVKTKPIKLKEKIKLVGNGNYM